MLLMSAASWQDPHVLGERKKKAHFFPPSLQGPSPRDPSQPRTRSARASGELGRARPARPHAPGSARWAAAGFFARSCPGHWGPRSPVPCAGRHGELPVRAGAGFVLENLWRVGEGGSPSCFTLNAALPGWCPHHPVGVPITRLPSRSRAVPGRSCAAPSCSEAVWDGSTPRTAPPREALRPPAPRVAAHRHVRACLTPALCANIQLAFSSACSAPLLGVGEGGGSPGDTPKMRFYPHPWGEPCKHFAPHTDAPSPRVAGVTALAHP